ncbi:uncharacterized protein PV06_07245 [Exophiala oligosperma]|uniref:Transcriptional coactivator HFI1/ADA1 n=2 Tax=Chaetothyriales TaxID=34395 RepID=A0A0D2DH25_9EURO|nr:uncharacterized protein PV06_07245 [Exophiala oligosperma]KAJ9627373.1 hypothetical protein H2204_009784 [Knufia peltigerae]KIW41715.1 hypothetical protein PV06_07245 [Exophiala oligosperma]
MATFDETFNPAALARSDTITSATSNAKAPPGSSSKSSKPSPNYPRVDLEPLYAELKSLIGHDWETYYETLTRFIRGELNAREFGDVCDAFIYTSPQTEHAHNSLILAVLCNASRDPPEPGLAAWVSATTDKSALATANKPAVTSDVGEQRLKSEVMSLPARDRRRLKAATNDKEEEAASAAAKRNQYEESYMTGRIQAPENVSAGGTVAGGITKTNWEMEIRKRYMQPLFAETLEFPDPNTIHARIVPLCYEEGVASGCSLQCAEYVAISAENYIKSMIGEVFDRVRSNGPRYDENSANGGILTSRYKRAIDREETEVKMGKLSRTRDDELLPCEAAAAYSRRPIGMPDLQLARATGPIPWNQMPLVDWTIGNASAGYDYEEWQAKLQEMSIGSGKENGHITGHILDKLEDGMDLDGANDNYGWEGAGEDERVGLQNVLADCLSAGG